MLGIEQVLNQCWPNDRMLAGTEMNKQGLDKKRDKPSPQLLTWALTEGHMELSGELGGKGLLQQGRGGGKVGGVVRQRSSGRL